MDCLDSGKGLYITPSEASFKTGEKVSYTNEDDELVEREIKLGTNYVEDRWIKVALMVGTRNESRLMELYVDGNRTGARHLRQRLQLPPGQSEIYHLDKRRGGAWR